MCTSYRNVTRTCVSILVCVVYSFFIRSLDMHECMNVCIICVHIMLCYILTVCEHIYNTHIFLLVKSLELVVSKQLNGVNIYAQYTRNSFTFAAIFFFILVLIMTDGGRSA